MSHLLSGFDENNSYYDNSKCLLADCLMGPGNDGVGWERACSRMQSFSHPRCIRTNAFASKLAPTGSAAFRTARLRHEGGFCAGLEDDIRPFPWLVIDQAPAVA